MIGCGIDIDEEREMALIFTGKLEDRVLGWGCRADSQNETGGWTHISLDDR